MKLSQLIQALFKADEQSSKTILEDWLEKATAECIEKEKALGTPDKEITPLDLRRHLEHDLAEEHLNSRTTSETLERVKQLITAWKPANNDEQKEIKNAIKASVLNDIEIKQYKMKIEASQIIALKEVQQDFIQTLDQALTSTTISQETADTINGSQFLRKDGDQHYQFLPAELIDVLTALDAEDDSTYSYQEKERAFNDLKVAGVSDQELNTNPPSILFKSNALLWGKCDKLYMEKLNPIIVEQEDPSDATRVSQNVLTYLHKISKPLLQYHFLRTEIEAKLQQSVYADPSQQSLLEDFNALKTQHQSTPTENLYEKTNQLKKFLALMPEIAEYHRVLNRLLEIQENTENTERLAIAQNIIQLTNTIKNKHLTDTSGEKLIPIPQLTATLCAITQTQTIDPVNADFRPCINQIKELQPYATTPAANKLSKLLLLTIGIALIAASAALLAVSFGASTPLSAVGVAIGAQLAITATMAHVLTFGAVVGGVGAALTGIGLFKQFKKQPEKTAETQLVDKLKALKAQDPTDRDDDNKPPPEGGPK